MKFLKCEANLFAKLFQFFGFFHLRFQWTDQTSSGEREFLVQRRCQIRRVTASGRLACCSEPVGHGLFSYLCFSLFHFLIAIVSTQRLDRDQLSAWIKILQEICMRAQVIEEWMSACEKGVATSTQAPQPESSGWFRRQSAASEEEMMAQARFQNLLALTHRAADFVQIIFCAPLVRDARRLMERYAEQCATSLTSTTTEVVVT
jgi:hypothetical protein